MAVFYLKIGKELSIMVIPETHVYMDGHPILTQTYNIYKDIEADNPAVFIANEDQNLKKFSNPNYLGVIVFEIPGKLFNYIADGQQTLSRDEIEEIVEQISYYRDNPDAWKHIPN